VLVINVYAVKMSPLTWREFSVTKGIWSEKNLCSHVNQNEHCYISWSILFFISVLYFL